MHAAKGLEFKAVAVVGCDEAVLPLKSVLEGITDPGDMETFLEQERQLLYVACSRAHERLFVSCSENASPLLAELVANRGAVTPVGRERRTIRARNC